MAVTRGSVSRPIKKPISTEIVSHEASESTYRDDLPSDPVSGNETYSSISTCQRDI